MSVAIRVRLNAIGEEDGMPPTASFRQLTSWLHVSGEIQLWIDGESVIYATGLTIRQSEGGRIRGMHFQTFFGGQSRSISLAFCSLSVFSFTKLDFVGHTPDWASPRDQKAWFADVTGVVIE